MPTLAFLKCQDTPTKKCKNDTEILNWLETTPAFFIH